MADMKKSGLNYWRSEPRAALRGLLWRAWYRLDNRRMDAAHQHQQPDDRMVDDVVAAVLAIVERQWQEAYGDAFQAGWWRGQHQLCPRCGVELAREVAAERPEGADHA